MSKIFCVRGDTFLHVQAYSEKTHSTSESAYPIINAPDLFKKTERYIC